MSKKAFIISGLGLFHLYLCTMVLLAFLLITKTISSETLKSFPYFVAIAPLVLTLAFGMILWKRLDTIGRPKRMFVWCVLFFALAIPVGGNLTTFYLNSIDFLTNAIMPFANGEPSRLTELRFVILLIPTFYLGFWGLFALLWFGSREPKDPKVSRLFGRIKRLKTEPAKPRYSDPVFINETWILRS